MMKKNYIIFAITFLSLLMGQRSSAQVASGDYTIQEAINNWIYMNPDKVTEIDNLADAITFFNTDGNPNNNFVDINGDGFINIEDNLVNQNLSNSLGIPINTISDEDLQNLWQTMNILNEVVVQNNYHRPVISVWDSNEDLFNLIFYDLDAPTGIEPPPPPPTEEPCTRTCESGYVLMTENCNCVQLPPCFNTVNTGGSGSTTPIINDISNILNGLGIGGDAKSAIIALAGSGDDLAPFANYLEAIKQLSRVVGGASVGISVINYGNDPTTQNLLQLLFDSSAFALTFASGGTAAWVSFAASFSNATGATSYVLGNLANLIDRSVECNVGQGIYNKFMAN